MAAIYNYYLQGCQGCLQKIYWVVSLDRARKERHENFAIIHIHGDDIITEHVQ